MNGSQKNPVRFLLSQCYIARYSIYPIFSEFLHQTNNSKIVDLFEKLFLSKLNENRANNETSEMSDESKCKLRKETAEWVYNCLYRVACGDVQRIGTPEIIIIVICAVIFAIGFANVDSKKFTKIFFDRKNSENVDAILMRNLSTVFGIIGNAMTLWTS